MIIKVGSTNPVKINAVIQAAAETWPEVVVKGVDVPSGVAEQPISDDETQRGAINRAKAALATGGDLGVGLEGGVMFDAQDKMWSSVWVAVMDKADNLHLSNGARFQVPEIVADRIKNGQEMGPIMGRLVKEDNLKQKQGMIGVITQGFVDRTEEYMAIVKLALGLWYGQDWQEKL